MNDFFADAARRQLIAIEPSLTIGRACIGAGNRLSELHLAMAQAALDDTLSGSRSLVAAAGPEEALRALADGFRPQAERIALYCHTLRIIQRQFGRSLVEVLPATGDADQ